MIELHIFDKGGRLEPFRPAIEKAFREEIEKVQAVLPIDNVDVIFQDSPHDAIPETGVGGVAVNSHQLTISINPNFTGLAERIETLTKSMLAHELHHCARIGAVGFDGLLWETMILEGLTAHFDMEVNGGGPKLWDVALNPELIPELLKRAEKEFDDKNYSYTDWFFGNAEKGLPRWAGYAMGFHIVGEYLKAHPDTTAAKLYNVPAVEFKPSLEPKTDKGGTVANYLTFWIDLFQ